MTPAAGTAAPPGTVTRKLCAPAVPTHSAPSQWPIARRGSVSEAYISRLSGENGTPPNANSTQPNQASHSEADNARSSVFMSPAYQGKAVRANPFRTHCHRVPLHRRPSGG